MSVLSVSAQAQTNLLKNGDFAEGPTVGPGGISTVEAGEKFITGWRITRNSVDYNTFYWQEPAGLSASLDLSGTGLGNQNGRIQQHFPTVSGTLYTVSFLMSGNPVCGPAFKSMSVNVDGVRHDYFWNTKTRQNTKINMAWQRRSFTFTATSDSAVLVLNSRTLGLCGPVVAGISVIAATAASAPAAPTLAGGR